MRFRVLGPLEITGDRGHIPIRGIRRRVLAGTLLLYAGKVVSLPTLTLAIWDEPPGSSSANIRTYVSDLRRQLASAGDTAERLTSHAAGYSLAVDSHELDLLEFEEQVVVGHRAMAAGDHTMALEHFDRAVRLYQGPPLEGMQIGTRLLGRMTAVVEQFRAAEAALIDVRLQQGFAGQTIPRLRELVAEQPLAEHSWEQLIRALHAAGRPAEALNAYHQARHELAEGLGIDPGAELQRLHGEVLSGEHRTWPISPASLAPAAISGADGRLARSAGRTATQVLCDLPPKPANFVGRGQTLRHLEHLAGQGSPDDRDPDRPRTIVVSGAPGSGKSATAIVAAHRLRDVYPDGQLYVSLGGSTEVVRSPNDILLELLLILGMPPAVIPTGLQERRALFRSLTAGGRYLLLLDDAACAGQVRQLQPGPGRGLVLVTGRVALTELETDGLMRLGPLTHGEASEMLAEAADRLRAQARPCEIARVVEACERLPLALRIITARMSLRPNVPLSHLADCLIDEDRRLDELAVGDLTLRKAYAQSYRTLSDDERTAFCYLGHANRATVNATDLQSSLGLTSGAADRSVEKLVRRSLLSPVRGAGQPQYRMSALLRAYAREVAAAEGRQHSDAATGANAGPSVGLQAE